MWAFICTLAPGPTSVRGGSIYELFHKVIKYTNEESHFKQSYVYLSQK